MKFFYLLSFLFVFGFSYSSIAQEVIINRDIDTKLAEYPGGMNEMMTFIVDNLDYSKMGKRSDGPIPVTLKIDLNADGSIKDVHFLNTISEEFKKELSRVIFKMPNWNPAYQDGEAIASETIVNLKF